MYGKSPYRETRPVSKSNQNRFSVEFRRVRIKRTFDTWYSNFEQYSIDNTKSLPADCLSGMTFSIFSKMIEFSLD